MTEFRSSTARPDRVELDRQCSETLFDSSGESQASTLLRLSMEMNRILSQALDFDRILEQACQLVGEAIEGTRVTVAIEDVRGTDRFSIRGEYPDRFRGGETHAKVVPQALVEVSRMGASARGAGELLERADVEETGEDLAIATCDRGRCNGILWVRSLESDREWTSFERQLLEIVSVPLGIAIERELARLDTCEIAQRDALLQFITHQVRKTLDPDKILQTAVRGVRRLLDTDRAIVYQFQDNWHAKAIAEDALPGRASVFELGAGDRFAARYIELYREGEFQAIGNLDRADLEPDYIRFLGQFEVRALCIVPILIDRGTNGESQLWGSIVIHDCQRSRQWQEWEVRLLGQLADRIAIALQQTELYHRSLAQTQRERLLCLVSNQIYSTLDLQTILQTAVREVRQFLKTDRVAIYQFAEDLNRETIVEDVGDAWPSMLELARGESERLDLSDARVLERLVVRAEAISPIVTSQSYSNTSGEWQEVIPFLWGLMVVHECKSDRTWTPEEIDFLDRIVEKVAIAIQQAQLYRHAQERARREKLLRALTHQIRRSLDVKEILQTTVTEVRKLLNTDRVVIYQLQDDSTGEIVVEDLMQPWPSIINDRIADRCFSEEIGQLYLQGRIRAIDDIYDANLAPCHQEFLESLQVRANIIVPIIISSQSPTVSSDVRENPDRELWGLLIAHECDRSRDWTVEEQNLLSQLAEQIAIALQQSHLYHRSRTQARQLQEAIEELKEAQLQLIQSEKLSGLGQLAAGVAHEINNANNFIYANLYYLKEYTQTSIDIINSLEKSIREKIEDEIEFSYIQQDFPKLMESVESGSERIRKIVETLQIFSSQERARCQLFDLHECLEASLKMLSLRVKKIAKVRKKYTNIPLVTCCPGQMNQVFFNIFSNALDAIEEVKEEERSLGEIEIETALIGSDRVSISIRDNGMGMALDVSQKMFDPFFTTKEPGRGTGLGLSTCYQIVVRGHEGTIRCVSEIGRGTEIAIELPIHQNLSGCSPS
ncbi:MAG: GAF domain-containing protein [Cyanobacteriota bacterium]|nr:GAF domain-containing protein [Cyanobacteriota bacterium]